MLRAGYIARTQSGFAILATVWLAFAGAVGILVSGAARAQDAPVSIKKYFDAPSVSLGAETTLTFELGAREPVTGVAFTDDLPEGLVIAAANGLRGTCKGDSKAEAGTRSVSFSNGSFAQGTCTISVTLRAAGVGTQNNGVTVKWDQGTGNTGWASIEVDRVRSSTSLESSRASTKFGEAVTFSAKVPTSGVGVPTGMMTLKDGMMILGTVNLSAEGTATLTMSELSVGRHSITAVYDGDASYEGSASVGSTHVVEKLSTLTTIVSPVDSSKAGEPVTFTGKVATSRGAPKGMVTFKDGMAILGTGSLLTDGTATLTTSYLSVGGHSITAVYEGDGPYDGSTSSSSTHVVEKSPTITTIVSSAVNAGAGETVNFAAKVTASAGTPTGMVTFRDGLTILGTTSLSTVGAANFTSSSLSVGNHSIVAVFEGNAVFLGSTSAAHAVTVQLSGTAVSKILPGAILLLTILLVAILLPYRKIPLVFIGKVLKGIGWVIRVLFWPVTWLARRLARPFGKLRILARLVTRVPPKPRPAVAVQSVAGASVGAFTRALAIGNETDEAIKQFGHPDQIKIDSERRFFWRWLVPALPTHPAYSKELAEANMEQARHFFTAEVPIESNAQNLYEDIDGAFIVSLFKGSDTACFHVLSEFKKAITANVMKMSVVFAAIAFTLLVVNVLWSTSFDVYTWADMKARFPITVDLWFFSFPVELSPATFNKAVFGVVSCFFGWLIMNYLYNTGYEQVQRSNGQKLSNYLLVHLRNISVDFKQVGANATKTVVDKHEVKEVKHDTILWVTNLQWIAFRVFFIESFLRTVLFQIHRNSSYYLVFTPPLFLLALMLVTWVLGMNEFSVLDLGSNIWAQNTFYVFFALVLLAYYRYLKRSLSFIWESVDERPWSTFKELNLQNAMAETMESYVNELDRWRRARKED